MFNVTRLLVETATPVWRVQLTVALVLLTTADWRRCGHGRLSRGPFSSGSASLPSSLPRIQIVWYLGDTRIKNVEI